MKNSIYILFFISFNLLVSQEKKDSVIKNFPEIKVESSRISENSHLPYLAGRILERKDLEQINPWQASEAISIISGIYIRNYGGLGGLKTISLRGSDAKQTSILIDGVKLNSTASGIVDLSILPSSFFNTIELIKGSTSAANDGLDGTINLVTIKSAEKTNLITNISFASFNERKFSLSASIPFDKFICSADGEYIYSKGDYPFETNQFGEIIKAKRNNGDFENFNISTSLKYNLPGFQSFSRVLWRISDRGSPGAVLQGHIESKDARLDESDLLIYSKNVYIIDSLSFFSLNSYFKKGIISYKDSSFFAIGFTDGKFDSKDAGLSGKYIFNNSFYSNELEISYFFSELTGNMINKESGNYAKRNNLCAEAKTELKSRFFYNYNFNTLFSSRVDYFSDKGFSFSPFLALSISSDKVPVNIKVAVAYNFRPPSFNEMYYFNYGNSNLKPEKQYSSSVALESNPFKNMTLMLSAFNNLTFDKIIYIQTSPLAGITQNFGKVSSKGLEFESKLVVINYIQINYNYTFQYVTDALETSSTYKKIIPYTPQELISGQLIFNYKSLKLGSSIEYVSHRFALGDNAFSSLLPSYFVLNSFASYSLNFHKMDMSIRLDALNILDEKYVVIKNYPMPGRMFRFSVLYNV